MTVFILAFAGALLGSVVGTVVLNLLKKVEADAKPDTPIKKILKPVAGYNEAPFNNMAYGDWLYHKKEGSQ